MEIIRLIFEALKFIFPAYCANAFPVIGKGEYPLDFGKNFFDNKPIFGKNKTRRGFFSGLLVGVLVGMGESLYFGYPLLYSVLLPLGALIGDIAGSFFKRRVGIKPGGLMPIVDQIDFVLGALLFSLPIQVMNWELAIAVMAITPPIHLLTNFSAYKLGLKDNPW